MTLLDFKEYIKVKEQALADYKDRAAWGRKNADKHRDGRLLLI